MGRVNRQNAESLRIAGETFLFENSRDRDFGREIER
jgi:hypothetical protein